MRNFKLIFKIIYVIVALVTIYFSFDILLNLDSYKEDITLEDFSFYTKKVPVYVTSLFIFLGVLMLLEIISENLLIMGLRAKLKKAEEETMKYKARLFDQSEETPKTLPTDLDDEEQDGEDDDEWIFDWL